AAPRRVTLERWTPESLERRVQVEFTPSCVAVVEQQTREPAVPEFVVFFVGSPEAAGHDEIPLVSQPVVFLVRVDAVDDEQELEQTVLREIQRVACVEAEASVDDDRSAGGQLDGGHAPE